MKMNSVIFTSDRESYHVISHHMTEIQFVILLSSDIDECDLEEIKCPLGCVNTIGSFTCAEKTSLLNGPDDDPGNCSMGYKTGKDGYCVG
jgi:hypothetical protein